jgi:uncharacterized membrane protein HdeD (DUF308 family)
MFVVPGSRNSFRRELTGELAERLAGDWWMLLIEGLLFIVAGVLIFGIGWTVGGLSIFIGALFILHGISTAFVRGVDRTTHSTNAVTGLLSILAGAAIIAWPSPGLTVVAIFLGIWLIVTGTITISGGFASRRIIADWWLWLLLGLLEIPLGVLALADPGATLAALVTIAGIWGVAVGVMCVVMSFEVRRLPEWIEGTETTPARGDYREEARYDDHVRAHVASGPS